MECFDRSLVGIRKERNDVIRSIIIIISITLYLITRSLASTKETGKATPQKKNAFNE